MKTATESKAPVAVDGSPGTNVGTGIQISNVSKSFGETQVLNDVSISIGPGELVCFLGPSGCGKTTLLRSVAGLDTPDSGKITIDTDVLVDSDAGVRTPPDRRGLGMVFQHYALWPHMTIGENIGYPLRRRMKAAQRRARVQELAEFVGLQIPLDRSPAQLSGGQQQRVALARALAQEPRALLLDEPLSNLDAGLRARLRRELRDLQQRLEMTTILVTHDQDEAAAMADSVVVMQAGRVVEAGPAAEVLSHPRRRFTAEFLGFENFLAGKVVETEPDSATVELTNLPGSLKVSGQFPDHQRGSDAVVAFRSKSVELLPADAGGASSIPGGTVTRRNEFRDGTDYEISWGETMLSARHWSSGTREIFEVGEEIAVHIYNEELTLVS